MRGDIKEKIHKPGNKNELGFFMETTSKISGSVFLLMNRIRNPSPKN